VDRTFKVAVQIDDEHSKQRVYKTLTVKAQNVRVKEGALIFTRVEPTQVESFVVHTYAAGLWVEFWEEKTNG